MPLFNSWHVLGGLCHVVARFAFSVARNHAFSCPSVPFLSWLRFTMVAVISIVRRPSLGSGTFIFVVVTTGARICSSTSKTGKVESFDLAVDRM